MTFKMTANESVAIDGCQGKEIQRASNVTELDQFYVRVYAVIKLFVITRRSIFRYHGYLTPI